jgi:hypothetical protein
MKRQTGVCAYCGEEDRITRDHVPPRLLFAKPPPDNVPTVPACEKCNQSFKSDDEYTRAVLVLDLRAAAHRDVLGSMTSITRSLNRPEAQRFTRSLLRGSRPTGLVTPSGAAVSAMTIDVERIEATGRHILQGLHYLERRKPVDPKSKVLVRYLPEWDPSHPLILAMVRMYNLSAERHQNQVGEAFSYGVGIRDDKSAWMLLLYGCFLWIGTIGKPPEELIDDAAIPDVSAD